MSTQKISTIIQQTPGSKLVSKCSRTPSTGDPTNPLFIPGLTLHLPPPERTKDDLFTLFESCARSKLNLKVKVDNKSLNFSAELFIEDNWVSTGHGIRERLSREDAASKALDTLSEFQPCRYNTKSELILTIGDRVHGLELHMVSGKSGKEDAMEVLTRSCTKCNLPVTWWDDGGGDIFTFGWSAVLLINGKPICFGTGTDLCDAKNAAAEKAIKKLMTHPVVISNGAEDGGHSASINCSKRNNSVSDKKESNTNCASEKPGNAAVHSKKRQRTAQSPTDDLGTEKFPNFTLFLPDNYQSQEKMVDHRLILLESCFVNKISIKVDCQKAETRDNQLMSTIMLIDRKSEKSLTTIGYGTHYKEAKDQAAQKAVAILQTCQPCVYKRLQFLGDDDRVKGLTLYLTSSSRNRKSYLSQLEESCAKCSLLITWWDDGGSYLFGPPWTFVLVINSRPICWGSGSRESVAKEAVDRLKINHTVVYDNVTVENESKKTFNERDSSAGEEDRFRFHIISGWYRRDGIKRDVDGSSNKLIENRLRNIFKKRV